MPRFLPRAKMQTEDDLPTHLSDCTMDNGQGLNTGSNSHVVLHGGSKTLKVACVVLVVHLAT